MKALPRTSSIVSFLAVAGATFGVGFAYSTASTPKSPRTEAARLIRTESARPTPKAAQGPNRTDLAEQVRRNVEALDRSMESALRASRTIDPASRNEFRAVVSDVRSAERRLHQSLKSLELASAADWERARLELAADYEAYVQAVAQAQRVVSFSATDADSDAPLSWR